MKHLRKAILALSLVAGSVLAWTGIAQAQRFSSSVDKGDTVNSSLYSAGKDIDINGTINGDVFCAGQTVTIDAVVHGDVICAGQDVTVAGTVDGDIRVAGQTVAIEAAVDGSATVGAMTFSLDAGAVVGRDLTAGGDNLNIKGDVGRDVVANGTAVTLNGKVGRNVRSDNTTLKLKSDATIAGSLTYSSSRSADLADGAVVAGSTTRNEQKGRDSGGWGFSFGFYLFMLGGVLLIGLVLAFLFPQLMHKSSGQIRQSFGKSVLVGLLGSFVAPLLIVVLFVTVIGIPLGALLLLAMVIGALLGGPVAGYYVGRLVWRKQRNPLLIMLAGGTITVTAWFVPWIGLIALLLTYWLGTGALLLTLGSHVRPGVKPKAIKA